MGAGPLGTTIPANCVPHTSFSGGADVAGDYRCAGLAIQYHTGGVARSPFPIWAGQWLFVDEAGEYRVGSCTFNRGVHPTIDSPSHPVAQAFPNDPTGAKGAYLSWKYGDTTDNLTAAAMWAVFHYYAQDAAGTNRASSGTAPLVPALDGLAADSGNHDLQARALDLEDEAVRFAGQWQLSVVLAADGVVTATLLSGATPVPGQPISVLVSGADLPLAATTGADGTATVTVPLAPGTVTVVASASSPGSAAVFRGAPASPDPQGAQTLVTAGDPSVLRATAQLEVSPPPTTVMPPTTAAPTTTTMPAPTTTVRRRRPRPRRPRPANDDHDRANSVDGANDDDGRTVDRCTDDHGCTVQHRTVEHDDCAAIAHAVDDRNSQPPGAPEDRRRRWRCVRGHRLVGGRHWPAGHAAPPRPAGIHSAG